MTPPYATITIPNGLTADASQLTCRDAITLIRASKDVSLESISFRDQARLVAKVFGLNEEEQYTKSHATMRAYFRMYLDMVASTGLTLDQATKQAAEAKEDKQPFTSLTIGGHRFRVPSLIDDEQAGMWLDLEALMDTVKDMHEVEAIPHILGTICLDHDSIPGTKYDGSRNADRIEIMHDALLTDAARITAFFFASSNDFATCVSRAFPRLQTWTSLNNALGGLSSSPSGEDLRRWFALAISSRG